MFHIAKQLTLKTTSHNKKEATKPGHPEPKRKNFNPNSPCPQLLNEVILSKRVCDRHKVVSSALSPRQAQDLTPKHIARQN